MLHAFTQGVLKNPSLSIHNAYLECPLTSEPHFDREGWQEALNKGKYQYRLFSPFLSPEPRSEITLEKNFAPHLIEEIHPYFIH